MKNKHYNIFYICVLGLLFAASCKLGANNDAASGDASKTASSASKTANAASDPKDAIAAALKNLQAAESWAAEVVTTNDAMPQGDAKMDVEYAAPDRFHIENNSGGSQFEVVLIGSDTYLLANGKWQKAPAGANMSQLINNWKQMYNADNMQGYQDVRFEGEETIGNKQTLVYAYRIDPLAAMTNEAKAEMNEAAKTQLAAMQNSAKIWIDADKNLPVKLEMTTKMTKPKEMTTKLNFDYKFDREVKIEAPALAAGAR